MATLTSTGINCSNGTLDGFYTGTTTNNTTCPIGSYVVVNGAYTGGPTLNNSTPITILSAQRYVFNSGSPTLAGTWRSRGSVNAICGSDYGGLMQRTA